jgi:subtilase family serine protease
MLKLNFILVVLIVVCYCDPVARPHIRYNPNPPIRQRRSADLRTTFIPSGFSPSEVKSFYSFSTNLTVGAGKTIGIVDVYDHPTIESDLSVFSNTFGLPECTSTSGCFRKVGQTGSSTIPTAPSGQDWSGEISLDVEWAHAIAPGANILLVLANSPNLSDMLTAIQYASNNADYVSMSFGFGEFSGQSSYDPYFIKSGVSFFASTGDSGPGVEFPAVSQYVLAVGGTSIATDSNGNFVSETGWSLGGGGCSQYSSPSTAQESSSSFQNSGLCSSTSRGVPDMSSLADPNTGVPIYNSYDSTCSPQSSCWSVVGGTSLATPITAARAAVSGSVINAASVYGGSITFRDIVSGHSTNSQGVTNYCKVGYDLVTGMGSWIGGGSSIGSSTTTTTTTTTAAPPNIFKEIESLFGNGAVPSTRSSVVLIMLCFGLLYLIY